MIAAYSKYKVDYRNTVDVAIIGAGPGGLAAAKGAKEAGAKSVIILERDDKAGGILNQCIHDGFGLIRYREQLTGSEYAVRATREALNSGAEIMLGHHVIAITPQQSLQDKNHNKNYNSSESNSGHEITTISREGLQVFTAQSIVLGTGCRERTRGAISIPGSRPAGVFTAGVIQNLVNTKNIMPGKNIIILGSGDIGMIMARRLTLEGANVKCVIEILPEPAGLARNVSQCLYDFDIPIKCSHTVSKIIGNKKLEAVEVSQVDESMKPLRGTEEIINCDCLVLSVGLIPENEVAETAGVLLDIKTNGAKTDQFLQTNVSGIFSCGNCCAIMDLADFVSEQGELAGKNAVHFIRGEPLEAWQDTTTTRMVKGFPAPNSVTCSLCPNGCQITQMEDGSYKGNRCSRGFSFAEQERTNPLRILTTTAIRDGKLIPIRSKKPIPLAEIKANIKDKIRYGRSLSELIQHY